MTDYEIIFYLMAGVAEELATGSRHYRRQSDGQLLTDLGDVVRAILADDLQPVVRRPYSPILIPAAEVVR